MALGRRSFFKRLAGGIAAFGLGPKLQTKEMTPYVRKYIENEVPPKITKQAASIYTGNNFCVSGIYFSGVMPAYSPVSGRFDIRSGIS